MPAQGRQRKVHASGLDQLPPFPGVHPADPGQSKATSLLGRSVVRQGAECPEDAIHAIGDLPAIAAPVVRQAGEHDAASALNVIQGGVPLHQLGHQSDAPDRRKLLPVFRTLACQALQSAEAAVHHLHAIRVRLQRRHDRCHALGLDVGRAADRLTGEVAEGRASARLHLRHGWVRPQRGKGQLDAACSDDPCAVVAGRPS
mmetsp:Transcript_16855/g.50308  ORF Transcript_16855/g.50308 Transcript_16855/m.50308 type:complete len:201 (+) Transcript_16855:303-905(+)